MKIELEYTCATETDAHGNAVAVRCYPRREDGPRSGAFIPVVDRGVTSNPAYGPGIGLSFDCEDGSTIRLLMTEDTAACVVSGLVWSLQRYLDFIHSQSGSSSETPRADVSPQEADKV